MGEVGRDDGCVHSRRNRLKKPVITSLLVVEKDRLVAECADISVLHVDLAVGRFEHHNLHVVDDVEDDPVDVRQLVAFGIDFPVVGVALEGDLGTAAVVGFRQLPGEEGRKLGVEPARTRVCTFDGTAFHLKQLHPVVGVVFTDQRVQIFLVVVDVKLLEVVLGVGRESTRIDRGQVL